MATIDLSNVPETLLSRLQRPAEAEVRDNPLLREFPDVAIGIEDFASGN